MSGKAGDRPGRTRVQGLGLCVLAWLVSGPVRAEPPSVVAALREARAAHAAGRTEQAIARLKGIDPTPLEDHVALLRTAWLLETDRPEEARNEAERALRLNPPTEVRARILERLAQADLRRNDLIGAYRAKRSAWNLTRDPDYAVRLVIELAEAFEQRNRPGDALRLYRRAWQKWPLAEQSSVAFQESLRIRKGTGAPLAPIGARHARADELRKSMHCAQALPIYSDLLESPDPAVWPAIQRGYADCLFQRRKYPEAAAAYAQLLAQNAQAYDAAILQARAHGRKGDPHLAVKQLERVARRAPPDVRARARYLLAALLERSSPARARRLLHAVEEQRAAPELSRRARWELAWGELRRNDGPAAIRRLAPLTRGRAEDVEVQRARYWSARARMKQDPEQGRAALAKIARSLPLSYYGWLAASQIGENATIERPLLHDSPALPSASDLQRSAWLIEANCPDSARLELESRIVAAASLGRAERMAIARLLHRSGAHFEAVRLLVDGFGAVFEQGIDPAWREAWEMAWPRPFPEAVRQATREFEIEPALVYAVMREESTYRPTVESAAGAIGLMQIVPPTATTIASQLGVTAFRPTGLRDPDTSIRFGAYYLKQLRTLFRGSSALAIAAYNAGPEAVETWVRRETDPIDEEVFIESVPYGETRRYLRRVLRSYHIYQQLYGTTQSSGNPVR